MPIQPTVSSFTGQASASAGFPRPLDGNEAVAVRERTLSLTDLATHSVAPPQSLRRAILRADVRERHVIAHQVAWLAHAFAQEAGGDPNASVEQLCVRADASRGDLPFDKAALKRAWRLRFPHLLDGASARDVTRDIVKWCAAHRAQPAAAARWHWLSSTVGALPGHSLDVASFASLPMREWPATMLSVALTLSNLREAVLPDMSLSNTDLRGVYAPGAQFGGGQFNGTAWTGAQLRRAGFALSNQINADFERADLRDACFRAADLSGARLVKADLRGAQWLHTVMRGANLSEAFCEGVVLTKACLDRASFHRARLHGASISHGSARELVLVDVKAKRSKWTSVVMNSTRAAGADLRGAEFRQCELAGWDARGARLNSARFESCDLRHARFCGASLKRVRIGRDCDLGGTQWQGARIRLDEAWLRQLTRVELDQVAQSWMTFPIDQPAMRAHVFSQLLIALSRKSGVIHTEGEMMLSLRRLPEHVQRSDWLGRLLAAPAESGGLGEHEGFRDLRVQWLTRKLGELTDVRLSRAEAQWAMASLASALHGCCVSSPEAAWRHAGAMCQMLHWANEGVGTGAPSRVALLRETWSGVLPPQVHVALSADGINALDASCFILIRADGGVAARLPRHLLASVLGSVALAPPKEGDAVSSADALPGWPWAGTRVVVRDRASPGDYVPGTMLHLQGLLREFGCLAGLWPLDRPLDGFVRLAGRWLGDIGTEAANVACRRPGHSMLTAADSTVPAANAASHASLSLTDRFEALVIASHSPEQMKLRAAGHADIEDVFREFPITLPNDAAPLSVPMSRRARLISVAAGLSWLTLQPEWHSLSPAATSGVCADVEARRACRRYALALLNELNDAMSGDAIWRQLPQAVALRACLFDEASAPDLLAQRLVAWLMCPEVLGLPGVAQACSQTLPWFWAISLPLDMDSTRYALMRGALPADEHVV